MLQVSALILYKRPESLLTIERTKTTLCKREYIRIFDKNKTLLESDHEANKKGMNVLQDIKTYEYIYIYKQKQKQRNTFYQANYLLIEARYPKSELAYSRKWLIHGIKHHKDNQLDSLELPYKISYLKDYLKDSYGNMDVPIF